MSRNRSTPGWALKLALALASFYVFTLQLATLSPEVHSWLHGNLDTAEHCCDGCRSHKSSEETPASGGAGEHEGHSLCPVTWFAAGLLLLLLCLILAFGTRHEGVPHTCARSQWDYAYKSFALGARAPPQVVAA